MPHSPILLKSLLGIITSWFACCSLLAADGSPLSGSTRITHAEQHARTESGRYPHREQSDAILKALDIQSGDTVVDIGAGDGWWSERIAPFVGDDGIVYAAEVEQKKVDTMKEKFSDSKQIKPYLSPTDEVDLPEDTCDMAFFSQVYHHLDKDGKVEYLKGLRKSVKPTGRLVVIEKYTGIDIARGDHGTQMSHLLTETEEAGWIPLRIDLITGTYHYVAVFAQKDLFPTEPERRGRSRRP